MWNRPPILGIFDSRLGFTHDFLLDPQKDDLDPYRISRKCCFYSLFFHRYIVLPAHERRLHRRIYTARKVRSGVIECKPINGRRNEKKTRWPSQWEPLFNPSSDSHQVLTTNHNPRFYLLLLTCPKYCSPPWLGTTLGTKTLVLLVLSVVFVDFFSSKDELTQAQVIKSILLM